MSVEGKRRKELSPIVPEAQVTSENQAKITNRKDERTISNGICVTCTGYLGRVSLYPEGKTRSMKPSGSAAASPSVAASPNHRKTRN